MSEDSRDGFIIYRLIPNYCKLPEVRSRILINIFKCMKCVSQRIELENMAAAFCFSITKNQELDEFLIKLDVGLSMS